MLAIRVVFLLTGAALGVFYPFIPAILTERGFAPAAVGLTMALASVGFTLAVPIWGHVADLMVGRVVALRIAIVGSTVAAFGLLLDLPPGLVGLCIVGYAAFESAMAPLADALAVNAIAGSPRSYARIRLLMSLGFAGTSILAGRLFDRTGFGPAPVLWAFVGIGILVASRWVPDVARFQAHRSDPRGRAPVAPRTGRGGSFGLVLRTQPQVRGVLLALALVHIGMLGGFTFLALRLLQLGGQPSDVALSAGLGALAEIPAMVVIPRLVRRIGIRALLVSGMIGYALVMVAWASLADPGLIILTRIPSGFALAAITISAVMTFAALLPPELQATGQGLYQTTAYGLSAIIANAIGGAVFGAGGAMPLFLGCAVLAAIGALVAWRTVPARASGRPEPAMPSTIAPRQEG